jgi:Zn-dependent M28 family amino/carboxypeptidase
MQLISAQNVVGILEGSDAHLKNECIVFMAHYDHLGTDENGTVFNGADDNATGCAILLELAEAFSQLETKPHRSMVFLWTTAEETGMLGSKYHAKNPVFQLDKTKAVINIDMAGRVNEPRDSVWKNSPKLIKDFNGIYTLISDFSPELDEITVSACKKLYLVPDKSLPDYFFRSSDHHHFHSRKIPVLNLSTGYHADYHKVTDEVSRIRFDKVKRVADLCFLVGFELANMVRNK